MQIASGGESSHDSLSETKTHDHDFQDTGVRIRKSKLALTGLQWSIVNKAKSICKDSHIFDNPFPTTSEDVIVRFDGCRSASKQFNMKGEFPEMGEKVEGHVSKPPHASRYILMWFSSKKSVTT